MTEIVATDVAVGDQVRVHFHPPNPMQSFCEGTVSRVDVIAPEGRFFVVDVTHEVILDRRANYGQRTGANGTGSTRSN
jgi:hypothetical protein